MNFEDQSWRPEKVFGVFEIKDQCDGEHGNCPEPVTAVYPLRTQERGTFVYFLCREHALDQERTRMDVGQDLPSEAERDKSIVQELGRTCHWGPGDATAPCGAAATHVVVAGVRMPYPAIRTVSVCAKHLPKEE
jgi:hypothetical protein